MQRRLIMQRSASLRCAWRHSLSVLSHIRTAVHLTAVTTAVRPFEDIPGPKPLPLIGNVWRLLPVIGTIPAHDFVVWIQHMHTTYGSISKMTNIPGKHDIVFLFDPRDFETILRNEGQWPERPALSSLIHYRKVKRKDFFEGQGGVLVESGEEWQRARTHVNPVMMQPRNAKMYTGRIDEVAREFVSRAMLTRVINRVPSLLDERAETPADFIRELQKWALESISLVALDTRLGCLQPKLAPDSEPYRLINAANEVFNLIFQLDMKVPLWKLFPTRAWRRYERALDVFTDISMPYIHRAQLKFRNERDTNKGLSSVLQQLLQRDPNPKRSMVMALDMMLAGIDTTSFSAACVLYHLARNPEKQERLFAELKGAMPQPDTPLTADLLENLKYLKACIRENNRINPVAFGLGRCISEDIVLSNYRVPAGTDVVMCNIVPTNQDEYFPEAANYNPDRWLNLRQCPEHAKARPFLMQPFGHGKRSCVGMRFALLELECVVARMVRNFRLEWHYGAMRFKCGSVYAPADPLRLRLFQRTETE